MSKEIRSSRWASILYVESCPENFVEILKSFHVPFLCSPVHDKDVNEDMTPKKPHRHIMLYFDSLKSRAQAAEIFSAVGGVGAEKIQSPVSYARYLCHTDDKDKAQYDPADVISYGIEYSEAADNGDAKYQGISAVLSYVYDYNIVSFSKLLMETSKLDDFTLFKTICDNAYLVKSFLASIVADAQEQKVKSKVKECGIDPETGEIL